MQDFFGIVTGFDWIITGIALFTLIIISLQLLLGILGAGDWDIDVDGNGSFDFDASMLLSPIGIIRFLCGASWYLVFVNMADRSTFWYDYIIAVFIGFVCFAAMALLYWEIGKLAHENIAEYGESLVGRSAKIYLPFGTQYEIMVEINGSFSKICAHPEHPEKTYNVGDAVTISAYTDGIYYIN